MRPLMTHPATSHPDLLVGIATSDDAGVFRMDDERALVQTVDFFTPIVDEAYDWGRIAAANALSDIYAMGGRPLAALQLVGWPRSGLPLEALGEVMAGGADVMAGAGVTITGGHSIDNETPVYGFAVTGTVSPDRVVTNGAARPGELIVLTKPLGTGVAASALKAGVAHPALRDAAVETMVALNEPASAAMVEAGVACATDVTGYGLAGHLREIMIASGVSARLEMDAVPVLEGIADLIEAGVFPGGSLRNLESVRPSVRTSRSSTEQMILADAQTSGGLLMAVPPHRSGRLLGKLRAVAPAATVIGEFTAAGGEPVIEVV